MSPPLPLLLNAAAGRGVVRRLVRRAADHGLTAVVTADPADLVSRVRAAVRDGAERVAIAGGDGTVHATIQELAGTSTALAIVPAGTGNDAARALGIPRDVERALDRARNGGTRRVDLGRMNGRRFLGVLGLGIDTDTNVVAERLRRRGLPRGPWVYPLAALVALARFSPPDVTLTLGSGRIIRRRVTLVAIANAPYFGGGMRIAPDAALDDGLLDVVIVAAAPARRLVRLLGSVYTGRHVLSPQVEVLRSSALRVDAPTAGRVQMDGEVVAAATGALDVDVERGALTVVA